MPVSLHKPHVDPAGEPAAALSAADNGTIVTAWLACRTPLDPYVFTSAVHAGHQFHGYHHGKPITRGMSTDRVRQQAQIELLRFALTHSA